MLRNAAFSLLFLVFGVLHAVDVPRYEVFEHTVAHPSGGYDNPWDVEMQVRLTSPSGDSYNIGGFYYEQDTYKFRFSPKEVGTWSFNLKIGETEENGTFQCIASGHPGFLQLSPYNPRRFTYESKQPFYVMGVQDCLEHDRVDNNVLGDNNWGVNGRDDWIFTDYLDVLRNTGFNLWRLNAKNCNFDLYGSLTDEEPAYSEESSKIFDEYAKTLKEKGFAVYLCIFGMNFPWQNDSTPDPQNMEELKNLVSFVVNRYGAYTDVWELGNEIREKKYHDTLLYIIANHLRSVDPHKKPISHSYARPELDYIDIASPHKYINNKPEKFDDWARGRLEEYGEFDKPIVYGELGNVSTCPYDTMHEYPNARHEDRWRVTLWTMFFSEVIPIFWHTENRHWCGGGPKNFHLDDQSMKYFQILTDWRKELDPTTRVVPELAETSNDQSRAYAISGDTNYAVYLYDWEGYQSKVENHDLLRSGLTVTINPSGEGAGFWMDPKSGDTLATVSIQSGGEQTIDVPDFQADAVLKITYGDPTSAINVKGNARESKNFLSPFRRSQQGNGPVYSIPGRRLPGNEAVAPGIYLPKPEKSEND